MRFIYVIAALVVACAVAPSIAKKYERCSDLPINIVNDMMKSEGTTFLLYKSNLAQERCVTMKVVEHQGRVATVIFTNKLTNTETPLKMEMSEDMTSWTVTDESGRNSTAHYLATTYEDLWACLYICGDDKQFIAAIYCGVTNLHEAKTALDEHLRQNFPDQDMPFSEGQEFTVVYDRECEEKSKS